MSPDIVDLQDPSDDGRHLHMQRFEAVLSPQAELEEQVAYLEEVNLRELSGDELAAMAGIIRSRCVRVPDVPDNAVDLCGTGGDSSGTFNVSTVASFVVAGAGVPVAKHGNRSVSSKCGSTDCLEKLGVKTSVDPAEASQVIREVGIAFMFAPHFHPAMANVAAARKVLAGRGQKTVFNILGPLVNPAFVRRQAMGVFREQLIAPVIKALRSLGVQKAAVFHGQGLDEVTLTGETKYARLDGDEITTGVFTPEMLGFPRCELKDLAGGDAADNARIAREILEGRLRDARRDTVLAGAAVGVWVGSLTQLTLAESLQSAADSLDSGRALGKLEELIRRS